MMRFGGVLLLQILAGPMLGSLAFSPEPPVYKITRDGMVHKSLYPDDGPVQVLNGESASSLTQPNASIVWVIKYYDVSCPHCWYFSAIYPLLAKALGSMTVKFGAMNCLDLTNQMACQAAAVAKYPTVMVYNAKPGDTQPHVVHIHSEGDPEDPLPTATIANWLVTFSGGRIKIVDAAALNAGPQFKGNHLVKVDGPPGKPGWTREAYGSVAARFHDAHLGLAHLLMDGYVNSGKYEAALQVVDYFRKCYAKDESALFSSLYAMLQAKKKLEPLEFKQIMQDFIKPFGDDYVFCKTKTCAVWQLFHGLAATIAIGYAPVDVSEAMSKFRFMVSNFLDCEACQHHFISSYDHCMFGRCEVKTGEQLMLWLWRLHNAVSVRVLKENPSLSQDGSVDRRWPLYRDCEGCWAPDVVAGKTARELTFQGQTDHDQPIYDTFTEDEVVEFLKYTYLGTTKAIRLEQMGLPFLGHRSAVTTLSFTPMMTALFCAVASLIVAFSVFHHWRRGFPKYQTADDEADSFSMVPGEADGFEASIA
jgi:hypothetical protein